MDGRPVAPETSVGDSGLVDRADPLDASSRDGEAGPPLRDADGRARRRAGAAGRRIAQRVEFFESSLAGVPRIVVP